MPSPVTHKIYRWPRWLAAMFAAFMAVMLGLMLQKGGLIQPLEIQARDAFVRWQPGLESLAERVLLVGMDEADIQSLGHPISHPRLAEVIQTLLRDNAAMVGIDIFRDLPLDSGYGALEALAESDRRLVFIEQRLGREPVALPPFALSEGQRGFSDLIVDDDGRVRRSLLLMWGQKGDTHASLGLQLALGFLEGRGVELVDDGDRWDIKTLGDGELRHFVADENVYGAADTAGFQMLLDFRAHHDDFRRVSVRDVLSGRVPPEQIEGRIVILGMVAESTKDRHDTPLNSGWSAGKPMDGIRLHAHMVEQLLRTADGKASSTEFLPWSLSVLGAFLVALAVAWGAMGGFALRHQWMAFTALAVALISLAAIAHPYIWLPLAFWMVSLTTSFVFAGFWVAQRERHEKQWVMQLFGKYTSPDVAQMLWEHRDEFMDGNRPRPQRGTATVLITDLQGFTTPSAQMGPEQVMAWINRYMDAMTEVAIRHHGFVDDYAGDGLKVDFGVPLIRQSEDEVANDAQRAVACALEMGRLVSELNARYPESPPLRLRLGINTGPLVAGSIGSVRRMKYTTVGDTVNTAARLESFDKEAFKQQPDSDFRLLISESTRDRLGKAFIIRSLGEHVLKGHLESTGIYRVIRGNEPGLSLLEAV